MTRERTILFIFIFIQPNLPVERVLGRYILRLWIVVPPNHFQCFLKWILINMVVPAYIVAAVSEPETLDKNWVIYYNMILSPGSYNYWVHILRYSIGVRDKISKIGSVVNLLNTFYSYDRNRSPLQALTL